MLHLHKSLPATAVAVNRRILDGMIVHALIERDPESGMLVGSVPGVQSAYTQGASVEELMANLREVMEMLAEEGLFVIDGPISFETAFQQG